VGKVKRRSGAFFIEPKKQKERGMKEKHVFITGGTGYIGKALCPLLMQSGYRITLLSRKTAAEVASLHGTNIRSIRSLDELEQLDRIDAIVNLAGESVLEKAWTLRRKSALYASRIQLTEQLCTATAKLKIKPEVIISSSAIGYYGEGNESILDESAPRGADFAAQLCADWEKSATGFEQLGLRVCYLRIGVVLSPDGGALRQMLLPTRLGFGTVMGSGNQWMAWIDRNDQCRIIQFLLENTHASGAINSVAPEPVRNRSFAHSLAEKVHRPVLASTPAIVLKLGLGERACLLLNSQRVVPRQLEKLGFKFKHENLETALHEYFD